MNGTFENELNVQLLYEIVGRILGEQYGVRLTPIVTRRKDYPQPQTEQPDDPAPLVV